jgi:hypothetical protein
MGENVTEIQVNAKQLTDPRHTIQVPQMQELCPFVPAIR